MIFPNILSAHLPINKLICILIVFLLLFPSTGMTKIVDRIVAVVNEETITLSELEDEGKVYFKNVREKVQPERLKEALQKAMMEVREGLIDKYLVSQKADKMNINVTVEEVNTTYKMMVEKSGLTDDRFIEKLNMSGYSEKTYKDNLRNQMLQSKIINYDVRSKIVVTEKMIEDYYNNKYLKKSGPGGYYLLQMGFSWPQATSQSSKAKLYADKLNAKKRAMHALEMAQNGNDFKELARKFSDLPSAADGGDIGLFQEDEMAQFMRDAIISLQPGQITTLLETPSGYQFFKLKATSQGDVPSLSSLKEDIRAELYKKNLNKSFSEWLIQLKENAYIKRL